MARWTCIHCLASFEPTERKARCTQGCSPEPGTIGASTLVFDPRESHASGGPRLNLAWIRHARVDDDAHCPKCGRGPARWICPDCHLDLPIEGAADPVASLVLIGPPDAGTSALASALVRCFETQWSSLAGFVVDPHGERGIILDTRIEGGGVSRRILRLRRKDGDGVVGQWITLVEVSGKIWEERREGFGREATFLSRAGSLVLVIDPRQLESVAIEIRRNPGPGVEAASSRAWRRQQLVDEIRQLGHWYELSGGRLPATTPLALALTNLGCWSGLATDGTLLRALEGLPEAFPHAASTARLLHEECEAELVRWNGESFLQQLGLKFPTFRFAPIGDPGALSPFGVDSLLRWALKQQSWPSQFLPAQSGRSRPA